ncbi:hypothetical protein ACWD6P_09145 [Streptomyces sp. NPDC002446]
MTDPSSEQPTPPHTRAGQGTGRRPVAAQPWWQEFVRGATYTAGGGIVTLLVQWLQHLL